MSLLSGLESRNGPPDQLAVAESEEIVASAGVAALTGAASMGIHKRIEAIVSRAIQMIVTNQVVFIVFSPFWMIEWSSRNHWKGCEHGIPLRQRETNQRLREYHVDLSVKFSDAVAADIPHRDVFKKKDRPDKRGRQCQTG